MDMQTTDHEIDALAHETGWLKGNGIWATGRFLTPREWRLVARFHRDTMASAGVRFFLRLQGELPSTGDPTADAEHAANLAIATAFAIGLPRNAVVYFPVPAEADGAGLSARTAHHFSVIQCVFEGTGYRVGAAGSGWIGSPLLARGLVASVWLGVPLRQGAEANPIADLRARAGLDPWRPWQRERTADDAEDVVLATLGQPQFGAFVLEAQADTSPSPAPGRLDFKAFSEVAMPPTPSLPLCRGPADPQVVAAVQTRLNTLGYGPVRTDGVFGAETEHAVVRFQRGVAANRAGPQEGEGTIDAATWRALFEPDATRDLLAVTDAEPEPSAAPGFLAHRWR